MQSYTSTYHRLRKREPLKALGFHQGGHRLRKREPLKALGSHQGRGGFNFCTRGTPPRGGDRFELPRLAEVVPNCLVASYDTPSESSGKF